MELFILTIFAGINLASPILSFFIWRMINKQHLYLYYSIFSFFSALYIFLHATSGIIKLNISGVVIFSAAVYYAIFPWFIFAYTNIKRPKTAIALFFVFLMAFLMALMMVSSASSTEVPNPSSVSAITNRAGRIVSVYSACISGGAVGPPQPAPTNEDTATIATAAQLLGNEAGSVEP